MEVVDRFRMTSSLFDEDPFVALPIILPENKKDMDFTVTGNIRGMSVERIGRHVCKVDFMVKVDRCFFHMVLLWFRSWTSPADLATLLVTVYKESRGTEENGRTAKNVARFFDAWTSEFWKTGVDEEALPTIRGFALERFSLESADDSSVLLVRRTDLLLVGADVRHPSAAQRCDVDHVNEAESAFKKLSDFVLLSLPVKFRGAENVKLVDFSYRSLVELAHQFTAHEEDLHMKIQPEDVAELYLRLGHAKKKKKTTEALRVHAEYTTQVINWAIHEVDRVDGDDARAQAVARLLIICVVSPSLHD